MSHQAVNWAIEQRVGGPSPKATLWSIANYANENWCSWPSQRTIGDESEQSLDTVQRRIRDLEQEGMLRRIPLHFAGRRTIDFFILKPSPFFSSSLDEIEPLLPRGYSVAPHHAAAGCGSVSGPEKPVASGVPSPDAAATATADAAATATAVVRQQENPGTKEVDDGGDARARILSDEAFVIASEVGVICGFATAMHWPSAWQQAPYRVQTWLAAGWQRDVILAACREAMANKRDGPPTSINYFDKPIAKFIARRSAPLPKVDPLKSKEIADAGKPATGWQESRDNWRRTAAEFGVAVDGLDGPADPRSQGGA